MHAYRNQSALVKIVAVIALAASAFVAVPAVSAAQPEAMARTVEFSQPLSEADRTAMTAAGVTFAYAVPPSSYVVRLSPGAASSVATHPDFVRFQPLSVEEKLTSELKDRGPDDGRGPEVVITGRVEFFGDVSLDEAVATATDAGLTVASSEAFLSGNRLEVQGTKSAIAAMAEDSAVLQASEAGRENATTNFTAQQVSKVDVVQTSGITGVGSVIGIWDGGDVRSTHQDLAGRVTINDFSGISDHATHVAGTMIGSGFGNAAAEGMAPGVSDLQSYDFNGDVPAEMQAAIGPKNLDASNHSYGFVLGYNPGNGTWAGFENYFGLYSPFTRDFELVAVNNPYHTIVKSSGNDRNDCGFAFDPTDDCDGFLGADGEYYDNIPTKGLAKNIITSGAIEDDGVTITSFSSAGPADDGRIKPDLMANGAGMTSSCSASDTAYCSKSGTSMSAPTTTGIVALLQSRFTAINGTKLRSDAVKAVLVNTATDIGRAGPDYLYGHGLIDAQAATETSLLDLTTGRIVQDMVANGETDTYKFEATASQALSFTLAWIDPAADGLDGDNDTTPDVINNLDIELVAPNGVTVHYPFMGPGRANPTGLATAVGPNTLDNVEIIKVAAATAGTWTVRIKGTNVVVGPQSYSLISSTPLKGQLTVLPTPCPIYDSTTATGTGLIGAFAANEIRTVSATGPIPVGQGVGTTQCVPVGASAAVYTISAIGPAGVGNLRLSPTGIVPTGGVVNYVANGLNNANTVTVPLAAVGQVDIAANNAGTGVRLVVLGYYSPVGTLTYTPLTPCAVADSRTTGANPAVAPFAGPFASGAVYPDIDVVGATNSDQGGNSGIGCAVPATADAVVVNLVAIKPQTAGGFGGAGYLSAGTGLTDPFEPVTPFADLDLNNSASTTVLVSATGTIAIDIDALSVPVSTHIRVVVLGYLDDDMAKDYNAVNPCAAFDSRTGQGASGGFLGKRDAGVGTTYSVTELIPSAQGGGGNNCGVPLGAAAVLINLVAIQADATGNLRAFATGTAPTGGVLNFAPLTPPMNNSNAVVVPITALGTLDVFVNAPANSGNPTVHVRGVILGYYE